jgi:hypothetical protein
MPIKTKTVSAPKAQLVIWVRSMTDQNLDTEVSLYL